MTLNPDDKRPSPLDFPDGLSPDEKAARWADLVAHADRLPDAALDAALQELLGRSRRGV